MTLIDGIFYLAALAVGLFVRDVRTILLLCLAIVVAHAVFLFLTLADDTGERHAARCGKGVRPKKTSEPLIRRSRVVLPLAETCPLQAA